MKNSEICDETHEVIGDRNMCEEIKEKVRVSLTKEGYKNGINEEGRIPVMKGFPKIHKENVKLRPVLDCRGNMFEPLEEKIKKVAEVIRGQQESASVKNSEELRRRLREIREIRANAIVFSVDVKAMFPSLRRKNIVSVITEHMKDSRINGWSGEGIKEALRAIWKNSYCVIGDRLVRIKEGLSIGSKLSPVLAEIVMNEWEKKVRLKGGDKLVFFSRYVDDCLGIWKGTKRQLEKFVKEIEDREKGIELELEVEKDDTIVFLDMRIKKKEGKIYTEWYQKSCASGNYCHARSDVDYSTKRNFIRNMEERIRQVSSEKEKAEEGITVFHEQLRRNGYDKRRLKLRKKGETERQGEERAEQKEYGEEEKKLWWGIESIGEDTEVIKRMLKKMGGISTYRKGSKRLLDVIREKKKKKVKREEEGKEIMEKKGVIYRIQCSDCEMCYVGETGKRLKERIKQHKADIRLERDRNAIYKHIRDTGHLVDWSEVKVLGQEDRRTVRKWKEARFIEVEGGKAMNWNAGLKIDDQWDKLLRSLKI